MELLFEEVRNDEDIKRLATMADEIWHEYWPSIIGAAQTDYMVETFQSAEALTNDLRHHGYRYWIIEDTERNVKGFTGAAVERIGSTANDPATRSTAVDERWPHRLFISKIYLYAAERGRHYASRVIEFYEQLCIDEGLPAMYLTVNRNNNLGIRAYEGRGFTNIEETDTDIGKGFVMTDYVMAKEID
jgi:GNAT superfamily N-acetyltransferase